MPDDKSIQEQIMEKYGSEPLVSAPVDPDNPAFDSLLGALKEVHTGTRSMDVLVKYHTELSKQLDESREFIKAMEDREETRDTRDISIGSLNILQVTMNLIADYIKNPTNENMADCLESFLTSRGIMNYVHEMLDENIRLAGME